MVPKLGTKTQHEFTLTNLMTWALFVWLLIAKKCDIHQEIDNKNFPKLSGQWPRFSCLAFCCQNWEQCQSWEPLTQSQTTYKYQSVTFRLQCESRIPCGRTKLSLSQDPKCEYQFLVHFLGTFWCKGTNLVHILVNLIDPKPCKFWV